MTTVGMSIINPTIHNVHQSDTMPELWCVELAPSVAVYASLDELRDLARELTKRLDDAADVRRQDDLQRSLERPTVEKMPTELVPGDEFFLEHLGWRRAQERSTEKGCLFADTWGEIGVLVEGGRIVYLNPSEPLLVAVPECEGSVMEQAS